MSTTAAVAVKPVRKFPPPCWTRDEALVLIEAYSERWHALHRAFLRNPDWDAVAEKVTTSCPDVTPPKTSAQCRHKMEKLRQRHRAEKQRASSFPGGRFFSSWFYFEAMEAMENGPSSELGNNNSTNLQNNNTSITPVADHKSLNPGRGIRFKPSSVQNLVTLAASSTNHTPEFDSRFSNQNSSYTNNWSNQEDDNEDGYLDDSTINETSIHPGYRNHKSVKGGIRLKPSHQEPAYLRPKKFSKVVQEHEVDEDGEIWIKVPRNTNMFQGNHQNGNIRNPNLEHGKKRGIEGIQEVVSSIKLLGDGFMKMEKMKIDMAKELERMRMETEMKRNQLILESQKQIVEAFLKGLIETRRPPLTETMAD